MQTIVINSQKGGSGKTALCAHLAVQAERDADGPVQLVAKSPQPPQADRRRRSR